MQRFAHRLVASLALLMLTHCAGAASRERQAALVAIDADIAHGRLGSAYQALRRLDPEQASADVVLRLTRLAVDAHAVCDGEQLAAFYDVDADHPDAAPETAAIVRLEGPLGLAERVPVLLARDPDDGVLQAAWGDALFYGICGGKRDPTSAASAYRRALDRKALDARGRHNLALLELEAKHFAAARDLLEAAVKSTPDDAATHYNLAYALVQLGELDTVAAHAIRAYDGYREPRLKSDAALLAAYGYAERGDKEHALEYAAVAERGRTLAELDPRLLAIYLEVNEVGQAHRVADALLAADPADPQRVDDAAQAFYNAGRQEELLGYFARNLARYETSDAASGALYFGRAKLYGAEGKIDWARADFTAARHRFARAFAPDHPVFGVIDGWLAEHPQSPK